MIQIFHHYKYWECFKNGMYKKETKDQTDRFLSMAINFTSDWILYGYYMRVVSRRWKYSCEHNLTNKGINRKAWIGHAAVTFALGIPEHITREAWWNLTEQQRILANWQADIAIKTWEICQKYH